MAHKVTLITRCSNAQEELINYAEEADQVHRFLNIHHPQKIQAWSEVQFINSKDNKSYQTTTRGRSLSTLAKQKNVFQAHDFLQQDNKQQLKFKLRHYQQQVVQSNSNLGVSNDFKLMNVNKIDQEQNLELNTKTNGFQRSKKLRNFSISQPKQKSTKLYKTVETLSKTSRCIVNSKQKASRPVKMSLFPVPADFCLYKEEQKLSLKLKHYIKKCSVTLNL